MVDTLVSLAQEVARLQAPDPGVDVRCWLLVGSNWAASADDAWRRRLPMDPQAIANGRTMFETVEMFPQDVQGTIRCWNVPALTGSIDAAAKIFPPGWFLMAQQSRVDLSWSLGFQKLDADSAPLYVENCPTEAGARLAAAMMARAADLGE